MRQSPERVANFRTRAEAEAAGGLLAGAGIPYLIQSSEGMGIPSPAGADLLVNAEDVLRATLVLKDAGLVRSD
jgi:hypothetical protein